MNGNKPAKSTNIMILGLGGVGYYLAKRLVHEGYAITAIEENSSLIRHADGNIDARLICGREHTPFTIGLAIKFGRHIGFKISNKLSHERFLMKVNE